MVETPRTRYQSQRYENLLVNPASWDPADYPPEKPTKFIEYFEELHTCPTDRYHVRLARGIWYFFELIQVVKEHLKKNSIKSCYHFAEIYPKNIRLLKKEPFNEPEKLATKVTVYINTTTYHNDLRNDLVFTKILSRNNQGNPYVPSWFSSMRREITLEKLEELSNSTKEQKIYRYKYSFFDKYKAIVYENDWIVIKQINRSQNFLFQVINVNHQEQIIDLKYISPTSNNTEQSNFDFNNSQEFNRYIYYKNINPCIYYLHMLGIYLYNIFFLGVIEENCSEISYQVFNEIENNQYFANLDDGEVKLSFSPLEDSNGDSQSNKLQQIQKFLAHTYFKLTFANAEDSYYSSYDDDIERIESVRSDAYKLAEMIAEILGLENRVALESYMSDKKLQKYSQQLSFSRESFFPFHKLIFDSVTINGRFCGGNQQKIDNLQQTIENQNQIENQLKIENKQQIDEQQNKIKNLQQTINNQLKIEKQLKTSRNRIIIASVIAVLCALPIGFFMGSNYNGTENQGTENQTTKSHLLKPFLHQLRS